MQYRDAPWQLPRNRVNRVRTADRPLWHPRSWPSWLALALLWLLARLPLRAALALCAGLAPLLLAVLPRRRRILRRNIDLCFPDLDAAARKALIRANLRESGRLLAGFAWGWFGSARRVARIPVQIEGLEHVDAVRAQGRGVLLVGAHMSHLELAGRLLTRFVPVAGMYREHGDPAFEAMVRRARLHYACAMFRRDALRGAVRHLKAGGVLWYAPDQEYRRGGHVFAPFFGIPAASIVATHQLARMSGAAVIGFAHRREADGSYRLRLSPPLPDFPGSDPVADTTRVNALLEQAIRIAPAQYLWLHARFKTRPAGEQAVY